MATRGFSFKGLVDYVLALKDSLTARIDSLTAIDVGAAKGGNDEINVANYASSGGDNSNWILVKTNVDYGANKMFSLHLKGSGGFNTGYTNPISANFSWYFYNSSWFSPAAFVESAFPIGKNTWQLANDGGKVAFIVPSGYYCRFTLSLVNGTSGGFFSDEELSGWTCKEVSEDAVNLLPNRATYYAERVYSTRFKPTPADIGAIPSTSLSTSYAGWDGIAGKIPRVASDGTMEIGTYLDFHIKGSSLDYDARISASPTGVSINKPLTVAGRVFTGSNSLVVSHPSSGGWARGVDYKVKPDGSLLAGFGFYGGVDGSADGGLQRAYMGCGNSPWAYGIWVGKDNIPWSGSYRIYHQGYKPTLRDIESDPNARGETENLMDIIDELRSEIAELKAKVK